MGLLYFAYFFLIIIICVLNCSLAEASHRVRPLITARLAATRPDSASAPASVPCNSSRGAGTLKVEHLLHEWQAGIYFL